MSTKYIVNNLSGQTINGDLTINGNVVITGTTNTRPYKVYTALLTQSGENNGQGLDEGLLEIGVTYYIDGFRVGWDFTNVGAPNNNSGTYFVATGTTPNSWGEYDESNVLSYNTGTPVVTVLENTIGNIWFTYDSTGLYYANSNNLFEQNKTTAFIGNNGIYVLSAYRVNDELVEILTYNISTVSNEDGLLNNTPIEIRVYN